MSESLMTTDGTQTTQADTSTAATAGVTTPVDAATQQASTVTDAQADKAGEVTTATEGDKPAEVVAPEKYEFTAPEGVTLDADALGEFEGIAKELKLSQVDAQKVTDIGAKLAQKWEATQAGAIQAEATRLEAMSTTDKEFGGDKLTESLTLGKKVLATFGTPELKTLLQNPLLGNHPEVIRFMARVGKAISEDRMVTGGAGPASGSEASVAKVLYPNQS